VSCSPHCGMPIAEERIELPITGTAKRSQRALWMGSGRTEESISVVNWGAGTSDCAWAGVAMTLLSRAAVDRATTAERNRWDMGSSLRYVDVLLPSNLSVQ